MRTLKKNKQKMYYSLYTTATKEYYKDENGNVIYDEIDGELIPRSAGIKKATYGKPIEFFASISSKLNEWQMKAYGIDSSSIYSKIVCDKGYLPLQIGSLVWRTSEIEWEDEEQGIPKESSADYRVVGIMDESLTEDWFLLQRNSSDSNEQAISKD